MKQFVHNFHTIEDLTKFIYWHFFYRLPSPFNKGNKCPTITNPSCKESGSHGNSNLNNSRGTRSTSTSSDRNKAQLNQQNNNLTSGKIQVLTQEYFQCSIILASNLLAAYVKLLLQPGRVLLELSCSIICNMG